MLRSISILLLGLALCLLLAACGSTNTVNLALNKPVVASSFEKANHHSGDTNFVAAFAVDGNPDTRWTSDFRGDPDPDVAWIYVDLGQKTRIQAVKILWEPSFARIFSIEVSDDAKTWQVVSEMKVSNVDFMDNESRTNINIDKPVQVRYVKVNCQKRATQYGYSIYEFEVY